MKKIIPFLLLSILLLSANPPIESSYYNTWKVKPANMQIFTYLTIGDFLEFVNNVVTLQGDSFIPQDPDQLLHLSGRCWFKYPHGGFTALIENYMPGQLTPTAVRGLARSDDQSVTFSLTFPGGSYFKITYQVFGEYNEMACNLLFEPVR